jgi:hypothetical protein
MVDEMNLLRDLKDVEPVRPGAFEDARAVLRAAMTGEPEKKIASHRRGRWGKRRTVGLSAAAVGAAAAAAALVATSASTPGKAPATSAAPAAGNPILAKLAADITPLQAKAQGDATLEIRNQSPTGTALGDNGIGLYTDDGLYYWGVDKAALKRAVSRKEGADDLFKRDIAAALFAVKGDITAARARMAVSNLAPGADEKAGERAKTEKLKAAAKAQGKKYVPPKPLTPAQQKEITDNHIWTNAIDALIAAPENPQVRAGVLRVMATMPKVKVTKTTTAGQRTLTLVDSWPTAGKSVEKLVINAGTGFPIAVTSSGSGMSATTYYHMSRVTLADVAAGKF